jgi:hypothetical protein
MYYVELTLEIYEYSVKTHNRQYNNYAFEEYPSSCLCLKHNVSETGFCLRPQVKPTLLGPIDRASPYLRRRQSPVSETLCFKHRQDDGYCSKA